MFNLTSIILAAGAPILVLLINELFHMVRDKRKRQKRFFYEIFPMRIKTYEEIIGTIPKLGTKNLFSNGGEPEKLLQEFHIILNNLRDLLERAVFTASVDVFGKLREIVDLVGWCAEEILKAVGRARILEVIEKEFSAKFDLIYDELVERIRAEAGIHIIDKEITNFVKTVKEETK